MITTVRRAGPCPVALETTLLLHGVPRGRGRPLADELAEIVRRMGGTPAVVGLVAGVPTVGLTGAELDTLLEAPDVPKVNSANLGVLMHTKSHGATTVSATMELAADAGVRVFATGGLGGVHHGLGTRLDISADIGAFARHPVAVVTSGVKGLLDVVSTRELLETLGIPVVGFRTDHFPAFYQRASPARVDARIDDPDSLAAFVKAELVRTGRGIVVANPIPPDDEIPAAEWERLLGEASEAADRAGVVGRDVTPFILARLHELSAGRTLRANLSLVRANAALAGQLAAGLGEIPDLG